MLLWRVQNTLNYDVKNLNFTWIILQSGRKSPSLSWYVITPSCFQKLKAQHSCPMGLWEGEVLCKQYTWCAIFRVTSLGKISENKLQCPWKVLRAQIRNWRWKSFLSGLRSNYFIDFWKIIATSPIQKQLLVSLKSAGQIDVSFEICFTLKCSSNDPSNSGCIHRPTQKCKILSRKKNYSLNDMSLSGCKEGKEHV